MMRVGEKYGVGPRSKRDLNWQPVVIGIYTKYKQETYITSIKDKYIERENST